MHRQHRLGLLLAATLVLPAQAASTVTAIDSATIESVTGLKGTYDKTENVFKVSKARDDVKVDVDRWAMPAFMGLTSWAAFTPMGKQVMVMGDTVVFEDEVNPAISAALDNGLEVTALHNHFFFDRPRVYFMHIAGTGDVQRLASGVRAVYDRIAEVRHGEPSPASSFAGDIPAPSSITPAPLEKILGSKVQAKDGMVKATFGRPAKMHGTAVGNEMGVNTWAAFAGNDEHAVVDGDFAMREDELQPVLKAMRGAGINIVAIHQHMTHESPRYMFLHYWGKGKATDLAAGVRKALDAQKRG